MFFFKRKTPKYLSSKTLQRSACKILVDGEIQVIRVQAGSKNRFLIHSLVSSLTKKRHIAALTNESASQGE